MATTKALDLALLGNLVNIGEDGKLSFVVSEDIIFDSNTLYVDADLNRVGIGITTPTEKLDVDGNVKATSFLGNATTASTWATARSLSLTGDATATLTSVDGSANVSAEITLATVNANVGEFGSATAIPVVTVNAKGLITSVSTATVSSTLPIAGDTGTDSVSLLTDTLTFAGTPPVVTAVTDNTVTISVNDATTTTKGIASFADADFTVSSGAVSIKNVNLGTQTTGNYVASLVAGTGISVGAAAEGGTPTITNTDLGSSQNIFKNIAVSGQSTIVADSNDDMLTLVAGTNVTITTDSATDTITISANDTSVDWSEIQNKPDPTITLAGDLTGSVTLTDLTSGTLNATIAANSVTLGTDTVGDYVANVTAGSGINISGTTGEGWSPTIAHADTSSQASVDNTNGNVIQDITLDEFGHITAIGSLDLDGRYYTETEADNRFVNVDGDTLTGFLSLHADPTASLHAATKQYVDEVAQGLQALPSAKGATTANLSATYDNGASGVGATLTAASNGAFPTIDGVSYSLGDNILVKDQTDASQNGSYVLTTVGDGSTPWVLTRCGFCDEPDEVAGAFEFVTNGTTYGNTGWVITASTPITIGTTNLNWTQFSGAGTYTAGTGLVLNGTQFAHADTSSVGNVNNSNNTFIQDLTFDTFGHVTGVTSGTVTVNDGTLTVNTSGVGLSGSGTFSANQSINNTITIASNATSSNNSSTIVARDASGNFSAGTITASLSGNASTASAWATSRTISLGGDLSGSVSIDGSANVTLTATVADDSHNHVISNVDGLQTALDAKLASSSYTAADVLSKLLTVDGSGSGLDADLLDGIDSTGFIRDFGTGVQGDINTIAGTSGKYRWNNGTNGRPADAQANEYGVVLNLEYDTGFSTQWAHDIYQDNFYFRTLNLGTNTGTAWKKAWTDANDGSGSGLDADTVDGIQGASFLRSDAADTATGAITFSGGIVLNSNMTWNSGRNITISGESSFDMTSGGQWGVYDGGNSIWTIKSAYGAQVEIGEAGSRGLKVYGPLLATTKSFLIDHPTKAGKKLRYGSLEGPENGVYVRGKLKGNVIELPEYWTKLVDPDSITVQLTPIGKHQKLYVEKIEDNRIYVGNENLLSKEINCFYYVLAERVDVDKLEVEID